jgi:hypothetical protein
MFIHTFIYCRQHVSHPSAFSSDEDAEWLREDANITLLYGELLLDKLLQDKAGLVCSCSSEKVEHSVRKKPFGLVIYFPFLVYFILLL